MGTLKHKYDSTHTLTHTVATHATSQPPPSPPLPSPPTPRLEAGAAANQASLAAPSASIYRGQMEARPHMLPHIRWQLDEGGWGAAGRFTCPLLPVLYVF